MPSLQQPPPTLRDKTLLCLLHQRYQCRIYSDSQHHSLWVDLGVPSSRLLLFVPSRLGWFPQDREFVVAVVRAHLQDNVGSWCVDSRSRGSNGHLEDQGGCPQRVSGSVHRPTTVR